MDLNILDMEYKTYRQQLPLLVLQNEGKYVLIKGDKIDSLWDTHKDAVQAGFQRFNLGPFLVERVQKNPTVWHMPCRVVGVPCPD